MIQLLMAILAAVSVLFGCRELPGEPVADETVISSEMQEDPGNSLVQEIEDTDFGEETRAKSQVLETVEAAKSKDVTSEADTIILFAERGFGKVSVATTYDMDGNYFEECKADPEAVDYVTLTIGGNDVGFTEIVTESLFPNYINLSRKGLKQKLIDTVDSFWVREDGTFIKQNKNFGSMDYENNENGSENKEYFWNGSSVSMEEFYFNWNTFMGQEADLVPWDTLSYPWENLYQADEILEILS